MLQRAVRKLADCKRPESISNHFRRKRFLLFKSYLDTIPRPAKILDIGGTLNFWDMMEFDDEKDIEIWLLNITSKPIVSPLFKSIVGDATDLSRFDNESFDIVFSNSVIEHVGSIDDQKRMAEEIQRVGKSYYVQTPNRFFPIEPHFLFPFFQFLPLSLRYFLITHFPVARGKRVKDKQRAINWVNSIRLLTRNELKRLFPGAKVIEEKLFGFTKSFTLIFGLDVLKPREAKPLPTVRKYPAEIPAELINSEKESVRHTNHKQTR